MLRNAGIIGRAPLRAGILNEVLSLNAQEFQRRLEAVPADESSMKS